jgi:hypothetical protein
MWGGKADPMSQNSDGKFDFGDFARIGGSPAIPPGMAAMQTLRFPVRGRDVEIVFATLKGSEQKMEKALAEMAEAMMKGIRNRSVGAATVTAMLDICGALDSIKESMRAQQAFPAFKAKTLIAMLEAINMTIGQQLQQVMRVMPDPDMTDIPATGVLAVAFQQEEGGDS